MWYRKLADIAVINALWKTSGHRVIRRQTFDIVVFNVMWKTSGHRVFRQQTFDILCDVENLRSSCVMWKTCHHVISQQTFCVVWKTSGYHVIRQQTLCNSSTDILCGVENFGSPCDSSIDIWHRVYCEKHAVTVWFVKRHLTLCVLWKTYCTVCTVENLLHCLYCGKLTALCVLWKTYCTVCSVENLLHCVYCGNLLYCVNRGKLTDIIHFGNMLLTLCVPCKTDLHHTCRKHDIDIMFTVENRLTSYILETWYWHYV